MHVAYAWNITWHGMAWHATMLLYFICASPGNSLAGIGQWMGGWGENDDKEIEEGRLCTYLHAAVDIVRSFFC